MVAAQIQAGRPDVQLDLSAVTACDRSGLRALVEARNDLLANHGQLLLLRPAACVTRLLRMTQLDQVMPILAEAALAACLAPDDEATSRRAERRSDPYHNQPYPTMTITPEAIHVAWTDTAPPKPDDQPLTRLAAIELAARGCAVFAGYHHTSSTVAVRIIVDNALYLVWPDEDTAAWLVAPAADSGEDPGPDETLIATLRCTGSESGVPTYAWARFLTGQPLG